MSKNLTGRIRHRTNWRGKLILQVEYTVEHSRDLNGSGNYDDWTATHWRDAKSVDLTMRLGVTDVEEALRGR